VCGTFNWRTVPGSVGKNLSIAHRVIIDVISRFRMLFSPVTLNTASKSLATRTLE
jgi:hypothetical protein